MLQYGDNAVREPGSRRPLARGRRCELHARAAILVCGGFVANAEMRALFRAEPRPYQGAWLALQPRGWKWRSIWLRSSSGTGRVRTRRLRFGAPTFGDPAVGGEIVRRLH
jgi:hypothetical protein